MSSDTIFWEFIYSLFGLFVLISIIGGGWISFLLGHRQTGLLGLIFSVPFLWFFQALLVFGFDPTIQSFFMIRRTGVLDGVDWILTAHLVLHPSIVIICILVGRFSLAGEIEDIRRRGLNFTVDDFLRMLNVLSNHPELAASGWFANRWVAMDDVERKTWVNHKLRKLRELWMLGFHHDEDGGFEAYGTNLPMKLAELDTPTTHTMSDVQA